MVREIISLPKLEVYYILDEDKVRNQLGEKAEVELRKIIYSIDRLGDSESLVTAASVNVIKVSATAPSSEVIVNTVLAEDLIDSIEGEYIYTAMPDMRNRKKPKGYYIPLSIIKERTDVYCPSSFRVRPKKETLMVKIDETSILFSGNNQ
jgi:CRISPR/Cas system-associated protein Cas5 (RAMP superfamily)